MGSSLAKVTSSRLALAALLSVGVTHPGGAAAQIPGENVNMVSGVQWPGGDPFLQRQNEPSVAVSSANPLHLLAGANDYRSVDLPNPNSPDETGDAWLGVFKSFDGGQTWQSVLLPGYPQDTSADALASPLHQNSAAADPVVRAGPNGMFYYSGITFNRGSNVGQVFVARFIDLNNKENGDVTQNADPVKYIDAHQVAAGGTYFVDKPWLAVDKPRLLSGTCTIPANPAKGIPAQSFKSGNIYLAYTEITNSTNENVTTSSNIVFSRSSDCGVTWSAPVTVNDATSTLNQGASIAIDPVTGFIYLAWRRYASGTQTDAIMVARSFRGLAFTKPRVLANIIPSDQDGSLSAFRAEGFPTVAISVDPTGIWSWAHVAWPQRPASCPYQVAGSPCDTQVAITTASVYVPLVLSELLDDCHGWTTPAPADTTPVVDDYGNTFTRGHQLMPQLTFSQGQLMLVYYDSHLDHTRGYFDPNNPFQLGTNGGFYTEERGPLGELVSNPALVYTPTIDDAGLSLRHTLDVRVAQAAAGPNPTFASVRLTQFPFGERGDEVPGETAPGFAGAIPVADSSGHLLFLQQLQVNPPNLPMFAQGTTAFMGDYIDIQGPAFVPNGQGGWSFNTAPTSAPVFHAVWTSNQDVRPPPNGDWTKYTPPGGGGASVFDPSQTTPTCVTGYEGTRNQNIYTSRITSGLLVTSPQNVKPLSPTVTRAFVVAAKNATPVDRYFRFTASPPSGVTASFRNDSVSLLSFDVTIPAHSVVYRSLFATSATAAATIPVTVTEVNPANPAGCLGAIPPTCALVAGGLSGSVTLNPPGSNPALVQPDGTDPNSQNIALLEIYSPSLAPSTTVSATNLSNTNLSNTNLSNTNLSNTNFSNTNLSNTNLSNSSLSAAHISNADIASTNLSNTNLSNTNLSNTNLSNTNLSNTNLSNASISDASYAVTNTGNTTASYHVQIVGSAPSTPLQLILAKNYTTPLGYQCQLLEQPHPVITASIDDIRPAMVPFGTAINANIPDPSGTNATIALAPGETAIITLRGVLSVPAMTELTSQIAPAVIAHAGGTVTTALLIQSDGSSLPTPQVGVAYANATLQAAGGKGTYTWAVIGALPPGLTLSGNQLVGTPTQTGSYAFGLQVTDQSSPPGSVTKQVTLTVVPGPTTTALAASTASSVFGQAVTLTATVAGQAAGSPAPTGSVTFQDGSSVLATVVLASGSATLVLPSGGLPALAIGTHSFTASYGGDSRYNPSTTGAAVTDVVALAQTATSVASSSAPSVYGQPVTFTATVAVSAPGAGAPTGTVSFTDGSNLLGSVALGAGGTATLTTALPLSVGSHAIVATYGGDSSFAGSASTSLSQQVTPASTATSVAASPNPAVAGQPVTFTATIAPTAPGAGAPTGTVVFADGGQAISGSIALAGNSATYTTSALAVAKHTITAVYSGDPNFLASGSGPIAFTVNLASTALSAQASPTAPVHGQAVTLTATLTVAAPGAGTPTASIQVADGTAPLGTATLTGGGGSFTATISTSALATGSHVLGLSYPGDANLAASSASVALTVAKAQTATTVGAVATVSYGQATSIAATVAAVAPGAGTPTGNVAFYDGSTSLGTVSLVGGAATLSVALGAGSHSITATYLGDANFAASAPSGAVAGMVLQAGTATTLAAAPNPSSYGQPVTFTTTVAVQPPASGVPTGTVQFKDGTTLLGTGTLAAGTIGSATASFTAAGLVGGSHSITATYLGDLAGNFAGSTSAPLGQVVNAVVATGTFSSSANPSTYGQSVTLRATVAGGATGTVTFTDGGAALGAAVPLSGGSASLVVPLFSGGQHSLTALFTTADTNYLSATLGAFTQVVNAAATATALTSSKNPILELTPLTLTATVTSSAGVPTGTVTFKDGSAVLGSAALGASGVATFSTSSLQEGVHSFTAVYGGSASFAASTSSVLSETVLENYSCKGFFQPLATAGSLAKPSRSAAQKYGSTVAVKWQLVTPSGAYVTRASANLSLQAVYDAGCAGNPASGAPVVTLYAAATGVASGSSYAYDTTANQHVLNWGTAAAPSKGCYDVIYTPDNQTPQIVTIVQLK